MVKITKSEIVPIAILGMLIFLLVVSSKDPTNEGYVNTGFNGLLVFATILYLFTTINILKDGQKSRQIEYKRSQLEKFYYPLHKLLNPPSPTPVDEIVNQVYPYQYLATDETRNNFIHYLDVTIDELEKTATLNELTMMVDDDIEHLRDEINELTQ